MPDMTAMIDCTFQLTFFFMLTLNFSSDIQSDLIRLPVSEIAKPAEGALDMPITVQALSSGMLIFGGDQIVVDALEVPLERERDAIQNTQNCSVKDATIIIRADRAVPVGKVQKVIQICQRVGFEKFVLRARPDRPGKPS
jgi:biopolymer transport protein ExbD